MPAKPTYEELERRIHQLESNLDQCKMNTARIVDGYDSFKAISDNAYDAVLIVAPGGGILYANKRAADISGYSESELLKMTSEDLVCPKEIQTVMERFHKGLNGINSISHYEVSVIRKDGKRVITDNTFSIINWMGEAAALAITRDITMKKQTIDALQKNEETLRLVIDNSPVAVCTASLDGKYLSANKAYEDMLGYTMDELKRLTFPEVVHPDDCAKLMDLHKDLIAEKIMSYDMEKRCVHKNGSVIHVFLRAALVRDAQGVPLFGLAVIEDITQRKQLETRLVRAQKMEAIGTMAGGIAHNFNNILGIILGNTELAIDSVHDWNPVKHNLDEVKNACIRAKKVVNQLVSFSSSSCCKQSPVKVSPIVSDSIKYLQTTIPTSITVSKNIPDVSDMILADSSQIHQVVMNLCLNAVHAMSENGGVLNVSLSSVINDNDKDPKYFELSPGRFVKICVRDTGHGITKDNVDKIFDPYFTTKGFGNGNGIGLSVVHGIVKNHNGMVFVESEYGKGSEFNVFFPVIENSFAGEDILDTSIKTGEERILIVDDEESLVTMEKQLLERLGYKITAFTNSLDALSMFQHTPHNFDLIITDMTMPDMTGDILSQKMLAIRPDIPVILCSGFSDKLKEETIKCTGIRALMMKPMEKALLARTIRRILDQL